MNEVLQLLDKVLPIIGVAVGAGLTYWFGALNRRHQETREDRTRWYDARLQAYTEFHGAVDTIMVMSDFKGPNSAEVSRASLEMLSSLASIRLVGSNEARTTAERVATTAIKVQGTKTASGKPIQPELNAFQNAARRDLGY